MTRQNKIELSEQIIINVFSDMNFSVVHVDDSSTKIRVPGNAETMIYDRMKTFEKAKQFSFKDLFVCHSGKPYTLVTFSL